ncbi:PREDICTED: class I histocompatibility antigen, F10 alpha chain-like, partial [Buceros rhinoceros silvestris]|uniref:class I histocompatibility antigen, F10 alpha chain-like n=1 Tax=Buceros rhinoceros silvestris TaxID=175836 RepID=UPI0005294966
PHCSPPLTTPRVPTGLHSLRYFHVSVSEPCPGVPQFFVAAGYLDGNPMGQYDSELGRFVSRPDWVKEAVEPQFRDTLTRIKQKKQHVNLQDLDNLRLRYNQSGTTHVIQTMYGCDLLEDNSTRGYWQHAYNGRDFIAFDMDTMTFTPADDGALITKRKWEVDRSVAERWRHYLTTTCIEWLRKHVSYGRPMLERK